MSGHVYRIFRVVALCALFCLHSALIGIIAVGMLAFAAGDYEALQFSMDTSVLFTIFCLSVFKYIRRNEAPNRILNLLAFSILSVLSLVGAIGLTARGASRNGKGLCEDFADPHPERCTNAAVAMTFTWIAVLFAVGGLAVSWLDRSSRTGLNSPHGGKRPVKELDLPRKYPQWSFRSSSSYVSGPTDSYVPRPRDPYDTPRRKRSTRSQPHQTNPQRVPSNAAPIPPLPPLPSFHPLGLDADSEAVPRIGRRQGTRRSNRRGERKDLPDLPPPTRRPPKDPQVRESQKLKHLSPTDLFAQMG
ncbi:hypothetical protein BJ322DRAFT_505171 [Thelephora terrestris]|uniref:MARVEL domain-containing protein n=1 Tax=Thelephora terrestris TaxID=56493 RepID=A0A9P6H3P3_9AGAM|nr:hypothetical protein BJ322DRAFT_505171 [Thelephora terrestris]